MENNNQVKTLDMKILEVLKNNGFESEDLGTYFYRDVIKNIVDFLSVSSKKEEIEELKRQVVTPYSQFYFDIARNDNDMGVRTFHKLLGDATKNANSKRGKDNQIDYMSCAFEVAYSIYSTCDKEVLSNSKSTGFKLIKTNK